MVKLKNVGPDAVVLWAPGGHPDSLLVEPGQVVDVPGELAGQPGADELAVGAEPLPTDAHVLILPGGERRAFPTSRWQLVTGSARGGRDDAERA